jgi:putative ABC transport system ATP-binding protein
VLRMVGLYKTFNLGVNSICALKDINLHVKPKDFITIIGSNGAGKSTLLSIAAGVYPPDEGTIYIDGTDVTRLPEHLRASFVGRVFQDPLQGTAASMTIEENLALAECRCKGRTLGIGVNRKKREQYRELLSLLGLGLEDRLSDPVGLLSGGQRQSLTLLMASLGQPKLLLLDEHTASLDPRTAEQVLELTQTIVHKHGLTVLMVTHNLSHALKMGNRTIMLDKGEIILDICEPERGELTVDDLLGRFAQARGERLLDDRLLLAAR